jgi:hypothetical protein
MTSSKPNPDSFSSLSLLHPYRTQLRHHSLEDPTPPDLLLAQSSHYLSTANTYWQILLKIREEYRSQDEVEEVFGEEVFEGLEVRFEGRAVGGVEVVRNEELKAEVVASMDGRGMLVGRLINRRDGWIGYGTFVEEGDGVVTLHGPVLKEYCKEVQESSGVASEIMYYEHGQIASTMLSVMIQTDGIARYELIYPKEGIPSKLSFPIYHKDLVMTETTGEHPTRLLKVPASKSSLSTNLTSHSQQQLYDLYSITTNPLLTSIHHFNLTEDLTTPFSTPESPLFETYLDSTGKHATRPTHNPSEGKITLLNNDVLRYEGEISNVWRMEGIGVCSRGKEAELKVWTGVYADDVIAKGTLATREFLYEGEFKEFQPSGQGKIQFLNGDVYQGLFRRGEFYGFGHYIFGQSQKEYKGDFLSNKFHGRGKLFMADGTFYDGLFERGRPTKGRLYTPYQKYSPMKHYLNYKRFSLVDSKPNSKAQSVSAIFSSLKGTSRSLKTWTRAQFSHSKPTLDNLEINSSDLTSFDRYFSTFDGHFDDQFLAEGMGEYRDCLGNWYRGEYRRGVRDGWGELYLAQSEQLYSGMFANDVFDGTGKLVAKRSGDYYLGEFAQGRFHGVGQELVGDRVTFGEWSKGSLAKVMYSGKYNDRVARHQHDLIYRTELANSYDLLHLKNPLPAIPESRAARRRHLYHKNLRAIKLSHLNEDTQLLILALTHTPSLSLLPPGLTLPLPDPQWFLPALPSHDSQTPALYLPRSLVPSQRSLLTISKHQLHRTARSSSHLYLPRGGGIMRISAQGGNRYKRVISVICTRR